jgi:hypothetical protein
VYGAVLVRGRVTLDLLGGRYVFCSLRALDGARLLVHAPTDIVVAGSVSLHRVRLRPAPDLALAPNDVRLFIAGGRVEVADGARVAGRLCAPRAHVLLAASTLAGSAVARRITAAGATVAAPYAEVREPCARRSRLRDVYFGDLHVHTALSFDAQAFDVRTTPPEAYRFARGEPVVLPPLDAAGRGTQTLRLDRPLDFAAVTDHSEFLGEVELCVTPGAPEYDSTDCRLYRAGGNAGTTFLGLRLALDPPARLSGLCGAGGEPCLVAASAVWSRIRAAADDAYDRTAACQALALGLDRGDVIVRRRLVQKMAFLAEDADPVPQPTDAEFAAYLAAHAERYAEPPCGSLVHVFAAAGRDGEAAASRAAAWRADLAAGASPAALGDPFLRGHDFTLRTEAELAAVFGPSFAAAVMALPPGAWSQPLPSAYGMHLVRVSERRPGGRPELAAARERVARDWREERHAALAQAARERLRQRYEVVIERADGAAR